MEWELAHKESWALQNWCFELRFWRRLLRVPWTARRSNQSILKEISPEYSLEELILKLKLQYFGLLMRRTDSLEKTLMLVKIEGRRMDDRGWDGLMASPTWWTCSNASSGSRWWTGKPGVLQSMGSQRIWTQLGDRTKIYPLGLLCWLGGKQSACNAGDLGLIPGSERSPEEGNGYPLHYSSLVNSMDRRAWRDTLHKEMDTT